MSELTCCPNCKICFRVTAEQLLAHQGDVRCGHCLQVFNAQQHLQHDSEPVVASLNEQHIEEPESPSPSADTTALPWQEAADPHKEHTLDLADETVDEVPSSFARSTPPASSSSQQPWVWMIACVVLLLVLLLQSVYHFRLQLLSYYPHSKPLLTDFCAVLGCDIPLPRHRELMSIESSSLQADPDEKQYMTLRALLRNRASYKQALPQLQLNLNNTQEQTLARRWFSPDEYLPPEQQHLQGLPSNHEVQIELKLDVDHLQPSGYNLTLYYPEVSGQ